MANGLTFWYCLKIKVLFPDRWPLRRTLSSAATCSYAWFPQAAEENDKACFYGEVPYNYCSLNSNLMRKKRGAFAVDRPNMKKAQKTTK